MTENVSRQAADQSEFAILPVEVVSVSPAAWLGVTHLVRFSHMPEVWGWLGLAEAEAAAGSESLQTAGSTTEEGDWPRREAPGPFWSARLQRCFCLLFR